MVNCNFSFTISCIKIQFILYSYNIYIRIQIKDHIYTRNMSTCIFITISYHIKFFVDHLYHSLPLTTRKIKNDIILITMSTKYFLIIWESNDLWVMSSLSPLWRMSSFSKKLIKWIITSYNHIFLYNLSWQISIIPNRFYIVMYLSFRLQNISQICLWKLILFNYLLISML